MDVTAKDNEIKDEVVAAYNEVLRKLKVVKKTSGEDRQDEQIVEHKNFVIEEASLETQDDLVRNLGELKIFVNKSLEDIKTRLLPEYEKFHTLRQAIEFSEKELNELYDIRVNVNTLNALIIAQKEKSDTFEAEMTERRRTFEHEMTQRERAKLQEEEEYVLRRDAVRKMEQEQYENSKQDLELELTEKRRTFEEEFEAREARLAARESEHQKMKHREAQITAREHEFKQLKDRAMRFPEEMRNAVQQAEQTVSDQLTRKYEYDVRLLQIELESERKMFQQKMTTLEEQIEQYKSLKQMYSDSNPGTR